MHNCSVNPGEGWVLGRSSCEKVGDGHRHAWGCKSQGLVSLRVFRTKTPLFLAVKVSFRVALQEII